MLDILFKRLTQRAAENDEDERKALDGGGYKEERCQRVRQDTYKSRFPTPPVRSLFSSLNP